MVALCSCPHFEDGAFCKHIWATLLAMDQRRVTAILPRGLNLLHDYDGDEYEHGHDYLDDDDDEEYDDEEAAESAAAAELAPEGGAIEAEWSTRGGLGPTRDRSAETAQIPWDSSAGVPPVSGRPSCGRSALELRERW